MKRLYLIQKKAQMPERKLIITRIPVLPRLPADPDIVDLEVARNVKGFYLVQDSRHRIEQKVQAYLFREVSTRIIVTHVRQFSNYWMIFLTWTINEDTITPGSEEEILELYTRTFDTYHEAKNGWKIKKCRDWVPSTQRYQREVAPLVEQDDSRPPREENNDEYVQQGIQRIQLVVMNEDEDENNQPVVGVPIAQIIR